KWNGSTLTDGTITDNGNIGIGVTSPSQKLEVSGTTKTTNLIMTNGANSGYLLQSDSMGNASWVNASSLETDPEVSSSSQNSIPRWNGSTLTDGSIYDNGNVGIGISSPGASAILDVSSTTKGFLMPRMTTAQRDAIVSPATGLSIFNTTLVEYQINIGTPASPIWSSLATSQNVANTWTLGGNGVTAEQTLGTTSNFDLPFITNNTEKMRLA